VIDETVRVTREFLESHPEFLPRQKFERKSGTSIEAQRIAWFLGGSWSSAKAQPFFSFVSFVSRPQ